MPLSEEQRIKELDRIVMEDANKRMVEAGRPPVASTVPEGLPVDLSEATREMPWSTQVPNQFDVVSRPSMYQGLPKDIARVMEMTDVRNASLGKRMLGFPDLPKYAFQLGAGATEAATLGTLQPGFEPETTGEAVMRGIGNLYGSAFIPLGPVVRGASALKVPKTVAGAAANVLAAEVQTGGQASAGRLILEGTFGALFGRFYNPTTRTLKPAERSFEELHTWASQQQITKKGKLLRLDPNTNKILSRAAAYPDADVRETSRMVKTFLDNMDVSDPKTTLGALKDIRAGKPVNYGIDFKLGEDPLSETPTRRLKIGITRGFLGSDYQLPKRVFANVERETAGRIKGYSEVFLPGQAARQAARIQTGRVGTDVANEIASLSGGKQEGLLAYLQAPDFNTKQVTAHAYNLTDEDIRRGNNAYNKIKEVWDRNYPDSSFNEFMSDILPRMRHASPAEREVLKFSSVANEMEQYAANHEISIDEKRFDRFSAGLIRSLSMKEHFEPFFKQAMRVVDDKNLPQEYRDYVANWARGLRGTDSAFADKWTPVYQKFLKRLGVNAESADVRDLIDNYVQLTHAGLVGFRAAPLTKNLFNGWQTGAARIGPGWYWKGILKSHTAEGWARARAAGMIEEAAHEGEVLRELGAPGPITKSIRKITSVGLMPYGKIDDYNRAHVFNGMYEKILDAGKKARSDEDFLKRAGLYRFHEVIQNEVLAVRKNEGIKKAAELAGVHAAQDTQWVYRTEYRPTIMQGEKARALLQFGVWPANYFEYFRQMTFPGAIRNMPSVERAKWIRDFALTNGSILALFGGAGASLGIGKAAISNTLGWTGLGPLSYAGGPAVDMMLALPQVVSGVQSAAVDEGARKRLASEPWRRIKANLVSAIPGVGLARDIARAKGPFEQTLAESPIGAPIQALESQNVVPAQSGEEEMFRLLTGIGVRR